MNLCSIFIFLNKTTNGGSENNLVYSNARELIVQNRKKRYRVSINDCLVKPALEKNFTVPLF
jgi:hypothetical protein